MEGLNHNRLDRFGAYARLSLLGHGWFGMAGSAKRHRRLEPSLAPGVDQTRGIPLVIYIRLCLCAPVPSALA